MDHRPVAPLPSLSCQKLSCQKLCSCLTFLRNDTNRLGRPKRWQLAIGIGVVANRSHLLSEIDSDGTPADATPTTYAARGIKLVVPTGKFVRQPLSEATAAIIADDAAGGIAKIDIETRIPLALALHMFTRQICNFRDAAAKACRTDHRAIRAGQAATGHLVPAGMVEIVEQQISDVMCVESFGDLVAGPLLKG